MKVIRPITITAAMLTSSVAEPYAGETEWSGATTYAAADEVVLAATHKKYLSLQAANLNHDPATSPSYWLENGVTNRYAMFDLLRNSKTTDATSIEVIIEPGERFDSLAVINVVADSIDVSVEVDAQIVYSSTQTPAAREVGDWYDYFFAPFDYSANVILVDIPPLEGAIVTVTFTGAAIEVGALVIGMATYIGGVEYNAISDVLNFSTIERDTFGNATLIPRRNAAKTNQRLMAEKRLVGKIRKLRDDINAAPAVWYADETLQSDEYAKALLILGYYRQFAIDLSYPNHVRINLELEEI